MKHADYILPHRLLVNRALRKEADLLREKVSAYQEDYKNKILQANKEIGNALAEANDAIERAKETFVAQLASDQELLSAVQSNLFEYTDAYYQQRSSKCIIKLLRLELQAISENKSFLSEQMELIGEEVQILEDRKNRLSSQIDTKDVITLLKLSGCDLTIGSDETARSLLNKVFTFANEFEKGSVERKSLFILVERLQEQAELLPLISYISWVVQQKIQFSKELSRQRTQLSDEYSDKQLEITDTQNAIDQLSRTMTDIARRVREYWAIPIAELGVELSAYYHQKGQLPKYSERAAELKDYCEEHKEVSRKLKSMAESHSDDSYTWDRLQRELKDLSVKIEDAKNDLDRIKRIESSIDSTKSTRDEWYGKRRTIIEICKKSDVYLLSDRDSGESDEIRIVSEKLNSFRQRQAEIEEENRAALERIHFEKDAVVSELATAIVEANAQLKKAQAAYNKEQITLQKLQESDSRFFLIKLFKESEEITNAKKKAIVVKKQLKSMQDRLSDLVSEKEKQEKAYDKKIKSFNGIQDFGLKSSIENYERRLNELLSRRNSVVPSEEK